MGVLQQIGAAPAQALEVALLRLPDWEVAVVQHLEGLQVRELQPEERAHLAGREQVVAHRTVACEALDQVDLELDAARGRRCRREDHGLVHEALEAPGAAAVATGRQADHLFEGNLLLVAQLALAQCELAQLVVARLLLRKQSLVFL